MYRYIQRHIETYKDVWPVHFDISTDFDMTKKAWLNVVSITFPKARGEDVRRIRRNAVKGKQG